MTAAAQQALRRTMEIYSASTRFALACNQSTKIIEPIQSRCAVLRYTRLSDAEVCARPNRGILQRPFFVTVVCAAQVLLRLKQICALESVSYDASGLEAIIFTAEGDMRNALNALQSTVSGFSMVSAENVFKVLPCLMLCCMLVVFGALTRRCCAAPAGVRRAPPREDEGRDHTVSRLAVSACPFN